MADEQLFFFDPDDTSDRVISVEGRVRFVIVGGASAFYRADDPIFAGARYDNSNPDLFFLVNPVIGVGDELTLRLGGPGDGPTGGFNGGGSCPSSAADHYGLGGGGGTEILLNGVLWAVAGGGGGGFRYDDILAVGNTNTDHIDPALIAWLLSGARQLRLPSSVPFIGSQPRAPFGLNNIVVNEDEHGEEVKYEVQNLVIGASGGEHDGADGVLNVPIEGLQWSTGAGGGGYGGGASGSWADLVMPDEYQDLHPGFSGEPSYWVWNDGKPGGSLAPEDSLVSFLAGEPDLSFMDGQLPDLSDLPEGHGFVLIRYAQGGWKIGRA